FGDHRGARPLPPPRLRPCAEHATIDGVGVWDWSGSAHDEGTEAAEWFSAYLGKPSRLVRFKEGSETRPTDPDYAQGYKVMFADAFPILIASQGSLDALNEILKEPVQMNRFRANIIVDGCHPYSEDLWKTVKTNWLTFICVRLRDCCQVKILISDTVIIYSPGVFSIPI
ncbi:mitochondrial amidoxime reducing component 2-like, partial [Panicum virgatum]|uniref:mitochondrial amidoxime reducing component 2-like n=1 Tax=Panicum virgatum TaxID=38727 RepID=UPI0019D6A43C